MSDLLTALRSYPVRPGETVHEGHHAHLMAQAADEIERLRAALAFYADRDTYAGIAFLGAPPHRKFFDDFDDAHGNDRIHAVPGKRARAAIADQETDHADR